MKAIYDEAYINMIETLRAARRRRGFTQAAVARHIGASRSWVGKIERGEIELGILPLVVLCRTYGLQAVRLIGQFERNLAGRPSPSGNRPSRSLIGLAAKAPVVAILIGLLLCEPAIARYTQPELDPIGSGAAIQSVRPWTFNPNTPATSNLAARLAAVRQPLPDGRPLLDTLATLPQYGNVDDGVPLVPDPRMPTPRSIGGDELALFHPAYLAVHTDRRLFINDPGNDRLVSVKLGYHVEERVKLVDAVP